MSPARSERWGRRRSGELVVPLLVTGYCLSYVWQTRDLPESAVIWPYALIGILAVLMLALAVQSRLSGRPGRADAASATPEEIVAAAGAEEEDTSRTTLARQIGLCIATLLFVPVVSAAGFLLTATLYLAALSFLFATARWYVALPGAFAISLGLAYLMVRALQIMFPTGWLDRLLLGI